MGLGKRTEQKGADKSRIKGAGRIALWRQRRKAAQTQTVTPQGDRLFQAIKSMIISESLQRKPWQLPKGHPRHFKHDRCNTEELQAELPVGE